MNTTQAFVLTAPGCGSIAPWPLPDGDITIEVEACAVCRRDTGVWLGEINRQFPDVLGHEVVGRVIDPGTSHLPVGTRVAGMGNQALARQMRVPAWQVAAVSGAGPQLALVEPLACAINATDQDPSPTESAAVVLGLGLLGLMIAELLTNRGRVVIGVDPDTARRKLAADAGLQSCDPADPLLRQRISDAGAGYECSGREAALWMLSENLPPGAALLLVAHQRTGERRAADLLDLWHLRSLAIRNPLPRTSPDMASCVRRAAELPVDLSRYPLCTAPLAGTGRMLGDWPKGSILRNVVMIGVSDR